MSKLPIVDAWTFERILLKWGFVVVREGEPRLLPAP